MATEKPQNNEGNEGIEVDQRSAEYREASDEQRMFREAIPISAPEITEEELGEIAQEEPEDQSENESKSESSIALLAAPVEADVTISPYRYGGRLFFKKPDGLTYSGTAEFVGEYNILLTAAHCVRDNATGAWFTDFVFYRGYKNGGYARRFVINYVGTKAGWVNSTVARYRYDYAFLRTTQSSDVGHLGYKTLQSEAGWTEFGYPANYGNNQLMQKIDGTRGQVQDGRVEMLGNPMRKGNSGGAWFIVASPNNRQAMGNQSHNKAGNTTDAWGPVFTNSTFDLLRFVRDAALGP
jgi:hypothetical protein